MNEQAITAAAEMFGKPLKRRYKTLDSLPVSGFVLRIQSLTEREKSAWEAESIAKKGDGLRIERLKDANRRLFQLCLVDADGNRYVSDAQRNEFADWDAADTSVLYDGCAAHCGINKADIEDLVKNSEATPVADSRID